MPSAAARFSSANRACESSSEVGMYSSQQCEQSFRTRRWASTAVTADPVRNGSTPISVRRVSALGASFVCSDESTKWPVRAESMEIFAASTFRACRTSDEQGAGRLADDRRDLLLHLGREAQLLERRRLARLVEQPHHDGLS